jgi:hypothetical protein
MSELGEGTAKSLVGAFRMQFRNVPGSHDPDYFFAPTERRHVLRYPNFFTIGLLSGRP